MTGEFPIRVPGRPPASACYGSREESLPMRHDSFLTPIEFNDNPELAALRILRTNLDVAEVALLATYPDCEPSALDRCHTEPEAYAISILYQIAALASLLNEYTESVLRSRERRSTTASTDDADF